MYQKIYDFCKVKNRGNCFKNGKNPSPRAEYIINLCKESGIPYELDIWNKDSEKNLLEDPEELNDENNFCNIMLMGSSDKFVVAHHDIVNPDSDNANDNSCSVINAIAIKTLRPEINVVILDGEEVGGLGSTRLSKKIKEGKISCKWILNLELTGRGGKNFFVGDMETPLTDSIAEFFQCPLVSVPFNDSVIFKRYGINSTVINPLPIVEEETPIVDKDGNYLDIGLLYNCHSMKDSLENISTSDMEEFVNEVCLKIIDEL